MHEEAIPIPHVTDADAAITWYERLGFTREWEHRFNPRLPAFVSIARGDMRLFLSEHAGDAQSGTLVYLRVQDVDALAARFDVTPEALLWAREIELRDPDGNRLRIGSPKK